MNDSHEHYARLVGDRLRRARQQRRLTLSAVEALTGGRITEEAIRDYEEARQQLPVECAAELAALYGVPVRAILGPSSRAEG
jgi:transcriptional regulator with XRE-family HTH domain